MTPDLQALATKLAIIAGLCAACWVGGCTQERHAQELKASAAEGAAKARQEGLTDEFEQIRRSKDEAMLRLADYLRRDLAGVQHRPARLPEPVRSSACRGSTGSELSREDAEFLVREAARADELVEQLRESRGQVNALRRACGG